MFQSEGCEITSRIVNGSFFDVSRIVNMNMPISTVVDKKGMLDSLIRAKMCSGTENVPVRLYFKNDEVSVRVAVAKADYEETLELAKPVDNELKIGFNSKLLIDSLKSFDDDEVELNMENQKAPLLMRGETDYIALVLPVMVKEA